MCVCESECVCLCVYVCVCVCVKERESAVYGGVGCRGGGWGAQIGNLSLTLNTEHRVVVSQINTRSVIEITLKTHYERRGLFRARGGRLELEL